MTISCHEMRWVSFLREIPQIRHGSLNPQSPSQIAGKGAAQPLIRFNSGVQILGKVQAFTQYDSENHK